MPTPVSAARLCLAADSASALDAAVAVAHRRLHTQTTSLHVVFALLSPSSASPPTLLRDALSRARTSAFSPRLQFKALDLCFSVALDRLPSSSSSGAAADSDEPPISNSLMAAIKRSQANQRRHPDTFHLYQQQQSAGNTSPAFAGVKVELQQLVLAILDDPIVSRVFGEAGFRSCDIKLAVLRPPPPILRFPRAARCPPLFLCNFSATEGFGFQFPGHLVADGGDENCRRIAEVFTRKTGTARNPMLVGVGAAEAAGDFARMFERQYWAGLPLELRGVKFMSIERELGVGDKEAICARMDEVGRETWVPGVVVSVGDLNVVDSSEDAANCMVSELTKLLELRRGGLWVMGWSATYETYLKFLSRYPLVDKDWNLQLLPITSRRTGIAGSQTKSPSLMDSFVPFGGLFPQAYESIGTLSNPYQSLPLPRCQHCNEQYEKEVAVILKSDTSVERQKKADFPPWLRKDDVVGIKEGIYSSKVNDNKYALDVNINDLQKKWNEHCQRVHRGSQILEAKTCQAFPSITSPLMPQIQTSFGNTLPISACAPKATAVSQSISVPVPTEPKIADLRSNLHGKPSKSEPYFVRGFQAHQATPSNPVMQDGLASPPSVTSVTTELALGAVNNYFFEGKSDPDGLSQCSTPTKIDESNSPASKVQSLINPVSCPSGKTWSCVSHFEQRDQWFDMSNCKAFYNNLVEKVGRQEEALWSISEAIIQCKSSDRKQNSTRMRGAIWLTILGPDRAGKKMAAIALAELIFGRKEDLICIDLSYEDGNLTNQQGLKNSNTSFWGKTMIDHIALEISKKPLSVFLLENVDKADLLAQNSLSNAIRTGKFCDSHGREFSINSSVFVTTAKNHPAKACSPENSPEKENVCFSEERIIAVQPSKMKILIGPSRKESHQSSHTSPCLTFTSKRRLEFSDKLKWQDECSTSTKKPHRSSDVVLDLNLPPEELNQHEENSISENSPDWLDEFFDLMDKTVSFKLFDFDSLADYIVKEISRCFDSNIGSNCTLEIDAKVIEQILAATWFMRRASELGGWIDQVLCKSLCELRLRYKLQDCALVRLDVKRELLMEEGELGMLLPSSIILE